MPSMWSYDDLAELQNEVESLAADYPFLASEANNLAVLIGDAMVDASPESENSEDEDGPRPDEDGFVSLDARPGYQSYAVTLAGRAKGRYHTREIAVYELARAMAEILRFPPAWIEGEHGPAAESIDDEVRAHHDAAGTSLVPLEHTRYRLGDLVTVEGQDWQPWVVAGDWGDLGIQLHSLGDATVTCFIPGTDLDDVQPIRAD